MLRRLAAAGFEPVVHSSQVGLQLRHALLQSRRFGFGGQLSAELLLRLAEVALSLPDPRAVTFLNPLHLARHAGIQGLPHGVHDGLDLGRQLLLQYGQLLIQRADLFGMAPQTLVDCLLESAGGGHLRA